MNDDEAASEGQDEARPSSGEPLAVPPAAEGAPAPVAEEASPADAPEPAITIADGIECSLDPRSVRLARTVGWIVVGVIVLFLLVPATLVVTLNAIPGWIDALILGPLTVLVLALVWSAQLWPEIEHRHASYRVDREGIEIRRGVLWRKVIHVPRSRVQHTDVTQGPLERAHGLGTLVVYTAGTAHAKVDLHGLDHGTALAIRDHLLPRDGDDAV